jgi:two-component system cell cycle sensor histidine kinase/response regulator CckA
MMRQMPVKNGKTFKRQPQGYQGVNQFITREKKRERLVREACAILGSTRGFTSAWIAIIDRDGRPVYMSESGLGELFPRLKERFDQNDFPRCAKTALARPGVAIIKDVFTECEGCPIASGYKGNAAFCVRLEKDGTIYGILTASLPAAYAMGKEGQELFHEVGEDIAFALYNIELEEKRSKIEKDLKNSEIRYRTLFEGAAEGILIVENLTMNIKYANPAMCQMLGYTEDELKWMTVKDIHPPEALGRVTSEFEAHAREEKSMAQQDIPCLRKDGTIVYTDVITTTKVFIDGIYCSAAFFMDNTQRNKAEDDKKKMEAQLLQSQKLEAVGQLTSGIAHDFNNILTTIIGNAEIILATLPKGDSMRGGLEEVRAAGDRAAGLIRQLLAFSRKQILQPRIMSLNETVNDMDKMLRRIIGEDIELMAILAPDLGQVEADIGQIEQVIMNLVVNARDAMLKGGKLTIETANVDLDEGYARDHIAVTPGPYVMLSVSDTGTGMTREAQEHLFEPFFTTKEKGKGTGLGLSTVYGIVKQSKGNIWVYSEPGKGTTFKVYLPRFEKSISAAEKKIKKAGAVTGSETILIVEDDEMVRDFTVRVLKGFGYRVLIAVDGQEAILISGDHEGPIHLMLTDVVMPGMSGGELEERLRVSRPDIKALYMSGYTDNAIVHHGVLDRGKVFLQKPFTPDALGRKVREVLENP